MDLDSSAPLVASSPVNRFGSVIPALITGEGGTLVSDDTRTNQSRPRTKKSRRELLAGAAGAVGVLAVEAVANTPAAEATQGQAILAGVTNTETGAGGTVVQNTGASGHGVEGQGSGTGTGIRGIGGATNGRGVQGSGQGSGTGVRGFGGNTPAPASWARVATPTASA